MSTMRTHALINTTPTPTAAFVRDRDWQHPGDAALQKVRAACGNDHVAVIDAGRIATALLGDAMATNMFLLGDAWQRGWIPLSEAAILQAIALNGVAVALNRDAFSWGRRAAADDAAVMALAGLDQQATPVEQVIAFHRTPSLDALIERRAALLADYQNAAYAAHYRHFVEQVRLAERQALPAASLTAASSGSTRLTMAVAQNLFKLMAYKDEYEVARLYTDGAFAARVGEQFEGDYKLVFHLAPPLLVRRDAAGKPVKRRFGPWTMHVFRLLARCRGLRGTALDLFAYTAERKTERALVNAYRDTILALLPALRHDNLDTAVAIASLPQDIRGFGYIKQASLQRVAERQADLMETYHRVGLVRGGQCMKETVD